jgi:hypothetical protein
MKKPSRESGDDADRPPRDSPSASLRAGRRPYNGPVLHRYGTVGKLTRSGTMSGSDGASKTMMGCL